MAVDLDQSYWNERGLRLLWFATLAGPTAWALNLFAGYASVKWACATDHTAVLTAVSAAAFAMTMTGVWVAWICRARSQHGTDEGGGAIDRSHFAAVVAIGLNVLSALVIVLSTFPHFVLSPCE
jgi:hypothetical protein